MSLEVREITIKLTAPMCDLLEFARACQTPGKTLPLSQFVEETLRDAPLMQARNRMARIDFGQDADQPDWESICTASAAAPSDEEKPKKTTRKPAATAATTAAE